MQTDYPFFKIPSTQKSFDKKTGGGSDPKLFIDDNQFESFKNTTVENLDRVINYVDKIHNPLFESTSKVFIELDFHSKALSKSSQPTTFLDKFNIDVYAQKDVQTFVASVDKQNLLQFRNSIVSYSLTTAYKDSAYLSAITNISSSKIEKEIILEGDELFIYFHETLSEKECEKIYKNLKDDCALTDSEFFVSNSGAKIIYSGFNKKLLDLVSEEHPKNPIQKIEKNLKFFVSKGNSNDIDLSDITIVKPELDAVVCIFDSGVNNHDFLTDLIIGGEDFIKNPAEEDLLHGTLVGTRVIFGNNILQDLHQDNKLFAQAKIIDIKMMKKDGISEKELVDTVETVLKGYSTTCKVYNLSLNLEYCEGYLSSGKKHYITRELDSLALKYAVLFVISAGNHESYTAIPYPKCLTNSPLSLLCPPADMLNCISVGSIADIESTISISQYNEPSPFTRVGLSHSVKPELCHYGGNLDKYGTFNGLGVKGFGIEDGKIEENIGTSFSAPLVSQVASRIYAYLKETKMWGANPPIELVKALLIHSAHYQLPSSSKIEDKDLFSIVGFGIPDFNRAIGGLQNEATFIYVDALNTVENFNGKGANANKNKIKFDVPNELAGNNKKVKLTGTLIYNPPISISGNIDYSLSDIEINLHYNNSAGTLQSGELGKGDVDIRNERSGVKHFEKIYTAYAGGSWEIRLTLKLRGALDKTDFLQNYALIISVEDVSSGEKVLLHDLIKTQYPIYQPVEVRIQNK